MTSISNGATIVLTRAQGAWRDRYRGYAVMIDGEEVAKVRRGQRLEFPVTRGLHEIFLKVDWCRSPSVVVDAQPDEVIRLSCEPGGSARQGLSDVVADTQGYIQLTRS